VQGKEPVDGILSVVKSRAEILLHGHAWTPVYSRYDFRQCGRLICAITPAFQFLWSVLQATIPLWNLSAAYLIAMHSSNYFWPLDKSGGSFWSGDFVLLLPGILMILWETCQALALVSIYVIWSAVLAPALSAVSGKLKDARQLH